MHAEAKAIIIEAGIAVDLTQSFQNLLFAVKHYYAWK